LLCAFVAVRAQLMHQSRLEEDAMEAVAEKEVADD
jgi:hypothetical protein